MYFMIIESVYFAKKYAYKTHLPKYVYKAWGTYSKSEKL